MATIVKRNKLGVWKDVIFALFIREIRTGFNDKFGLSWAILNPLIFIVILSYGRSFIGGEITHTMPTFSFMLYGMLLIQLFLTTLNSGTSAITKNKSLFSFKQVQPISSIIATVTFELLIKFAVVIFIVLFMYLMGLEIRIDDPLKLIMNILALWLLASSLSCVFAISVCYIPELNKVFGLLTRPLFFISGIFFSLQDIPKEYWYLLDWNPILHAVELSRDAAYTTFNAQGVSENYLLICTLTITFFALAVYHAYWKQAISR